MRCPVASYLLMCQKSGLPVKLSECPLIGVETRLTYEDVLTSIAFSFPLPKTNWKQANLSAIEVICVIFSLFRLVSKKKVMQSIVNRFFIHCK